MIPDVCRRSIQNPTATYPLCPPPVSRCLMRRGPHFCQKSAVTFQSSLQCRPLFGHQNCALFVVGVEKTDLLDPGRVPSLKPNSDRKLPLLPARCSVPPATVVVSTPPITPSPRLPASSACNGSDVLCSDFKGSDLWRWCHSAHDVVGKARLSQGMSCHRKKATCALTKRN